MIKSTSYLPLFRENGEWIERPDFMVIAALSQGTEIDRQHVYRSMLEEELLNPNQNASGMSDFAKDVEKKKVRGDVTHRVMAGTVVLELARIASSTGKPPTIKSARRLTAYNYLKHSEKCPQDPDERRTNERSYLREVEKGLGKYKTILHLLAAGVYDTQLLQNIEGDEESLRRFLGIARAFESFIDINVVSNSFEWTPWRVPTRIESVPKLIFLPLSDQELAAALDL